MRSLVQKTAVTLVVGLVCCVSRARAEVKSQLTFTGPFEKHDHKGRRVIPYFEKTGYAHIRQSFVRVSFVISQRVGGAVCDDVWCPSASGVTALP